MNYNLETTRLKLELVNEHIIEKYFALINSPEVLETMGSFNYPLDRSRMVPAFLMENNQEDLHWAIIEKKGQEIIGGCSLLEINQARKNVEIGYWLASSQQGKGFAVEASAKLVEFAFKVLKLHKIWGETISNNEASKKLLFKIGFKEIGILREEVIKNGIWLDRVRLELLEKDWKK